MIEILILNQEIEGVIMKSLFNVKLVDYGSGKGWIRNGVKMECPLTEFNAACGEWCPAFLYNNDSVVIKCFKETLFYPINKD